MPSGENSVFECEFAGITGCARAVKKVLIKLFENEIEFTVCWTLTDVLLEIYRY